MTVTKDEAARALAEIDAARTATLTLRRYRDAAPHFIVWGLVWLIANGVGEFIPAFRGKTWMWLTILGTASSFWFGMRSTSKGSKAEARRRGLRWVATMTIIIVYFITMMKVLPNFNSRQYSVYLSLFWTFLYMLTGIWAGWKIFAVGLISTSLVLFGYFNIETHFQLWMGAVGGGTLLAGGLWLRRA